MLSTSTKKKKTEWRNLFLKTEETCWELFWISSEHFEKPLRWAVVYHRMCALPAGWEVESKPWNTCRKLGERGSIEFWRPCVTPFFQNWRHCYSKGNLVISPWFNQHCGMHMRNFILYIIVVAPNSCMIAALTLQVQKIVITKHCCCWDVNLVPKIFDHVTELYCQHYRIPYCLHLHCEVRTVSSLEYWHYSPCLHTTII
jgi:hypothetical protein